MSLTNPNKVVTEARLNEYHQAILPYLGGMPDILANKFSKSDLYSTSERIIGRWIDGKPLYQRSYSFTAPTVTSSTSVWSDIVTLDTTFEVKSVDGYLNWNSGSNVGMCNISIYLNPTNFAMVSLSDHIVTLNIAGSHFSEQPGVITVRYTKTTDSAVEIGNDTDYSTTEKIVGTWIDGKPLYQKTIKEVISTYIDSSSRRTFRTSDVVLNPDYFVLCDWCLGSTKSGTTAFISGCGMTTTATIRRSVEMYIENNNAKLQAHTLVSDAFTSATIIATIRYTKTID